jgi:hypothetical protein
MLFRIFLLLGILSLSPPLSAHQKPTLGTGWQSIQNLPNSNERDRIQDVLDKEYGCQTVPTKRASFPDKGSDRLIIHPCQNAEIRKLLIGNDKDVIAIGLPSTGNCGDFNFSFLSPVDANDHRHVLKGPDNGRTCAEGLRDVPGQSPFKIVVEGDDRPPGPHTNIDVEFEWDGSDLKEVR